MLETAVLGCSRSMRSLGLNQAVPRRAGVGGPPCPEGHKGRGAGGVAVLAAEAGPHCHTPDAAAAPRSPQEGGRVFKPVFDVEMQPGALCTAIKCYYVMARGD